jgi:molecular chaperone GrpE
MAKAKKDNVFDESTLNAETNTETPDIPDTPETPETSETTVASDAQETQPVSPVEELEAALKAEKDRYLRLAAEYDNYRKRTLKEREAIYSDAQSDTIRELLPIYDNLARALKMECQDAAFYKGIELTMAQLMEIFEKLGVTEIPAVGEPFNPDYHNAVMHVEDPSLGESIVAEEFQKGFKLGDKVIRCSMVKVAN